MLRPRDVFGRFAQPRRRTAAGVRTGGVVLATAPGGRVGTMVGVVDVSAVGACYCGTSGWGIVGQSEVGHGDTLVPGPADRVTLAIAGSSWVHHCEVQ